MVANCFPLRAPFGDHLPVVVELNITSPEPKTTIMRDWRKYTPLRCSEHFAYSDFRVDCTDVQQFWNMLENKIINKVDTLIPLKEFTNNRVPNSKSPVAIRSKINKRKRLIKKHRLNPSPALHAQLRLIDKEIKKKLPQKILLHSKQNFSWQQSQSMVGR